MITTQYDETRAPDDVRTALKRQVPHRNALNRYDWFISASAAALTVATLSPVLTTSFGFLDDYIALYAHQTDPSVMREAAVLQGRPVVALLFSGFLSFVDTVGELAIMRAFSVALLAAVAACTFTLLRRLDYDRLPAWLFAVGMLWLPSTQVMASWATLLMAPVALTFGVLATTSLDRSLDRVAGGHESKIVRVKLLLPAVAMLSLALCTYQPAAMVYWPYVLLLLLAPVRRAWSARKLLTAAIVAGVTGAAACATAYAVLVIGASFVGAVDARSTVVTDFTAKAEFLLTQAAPRIFDPLELTPRPALALLIACVLVVFLFFAIGGGLRRQTVGLALFLMALPLSYFPSVITAENFASARSLVAAFIVPLAAITLILQSPPLTKPWGGAWIRLAGAAVIGALAFYVGFNRVSDYFAKPQQRELALARAQVRPLLANARSPIVFVRSDYYTDSLAPGVSYGEFGHSSTSSVAGAFTQNLAREETSRFLPGVELVERSQIRSLPATTIVVDYGHLLDATENAVVYQAGEGLESK